jgi:hypothetical protein
MRINFARKLENLPVKLFPILLFILLISAIVFPAAAEDPDFEDMLKKAQNLNVTIPQKGNALLGTQESMTEYLDWLNANTDSIINLVNDVMDVLGIGNTSYAQDFKNMLETGRTLSPARVAK